MPDDVQPLTPDDLDPDEIEAAWAAVSAQMRSESYEELLVEVKRRALEGDVRWQMYLLQVEDPERYGEPGEGIDFGPIPVPERLEHSPPAEEPSRIVESEPADPTPKRHFRQALTLLATQEPDMSLSELERRVGCSRGYASRLLRQVGVEVERRQESGAGSRKLIELARNGDAADRRDRREGRRQPECPSLEASVSPGSASRPASMRVPTAGSGGADASVGVDGVDPPRPHSPRTFAMTSDRDEWGEVRSPRNSSPRSACSASRSGATASGSSSRLSRGASAASQGGSRGIDWVWRPSRLKSREGMAVRSLGAWVEVPDTSRSGEGKGEAMWKGLKSNHAVVGALLATLVLGGGIVLGVAPAFADHADAANFVFLNDTGQDANDLHVLFNVDMMNSIIGWQNQGVDLPVHMRVGSWVHLSGAIVPDQSGTEFRFAAMVPDGMDLEVLEAYWTWDGENIGAAAFHKN